MIGPFADELMTAFLPQDSWRHRHDALKITIVNMCNEARLPIDCEVYGIFKDLIPATMTEEGGELQFGRQQMGLCPDFRLRLPTPDGPQDLWGSQGIQLEKQRSRWTGEPENFLELIGDPWQVARLDRL